MTQTLLQTLKQFMYNRLEEYRVLIDLNRQIEELVEKGALDDLAEVLNTKNSQIAQVNRLQEELKNRLQGDFHQLRLNQEGWNLLFASLSANEREELKPLVQITHTLLETMQNQEELIFEKFANSKERLREQMQAAKANKKAHQAYEQYNSTALFIDKQR